MLQKVAILQVEQQSTVKIKAPSLAFSLLKFTNISIAVLHKKTHSRPPNGDNIVVKLPMKMYSTGTSQTPNKHQIHLPPSIVLTRATGALTYT